MPAPVRFDYDPDHPDWEPTGGYRFVVPPGEYAIPFVVVGASGGPSAEGTPGGKGAYLEGVLTTFPGAVLVIRPGEAGAASDGLTSAPATYGGSGGGAAGSNAGSGGGGSAISFEFGEEGEPAEWEHSVVTVGGGGGAGSHAGTGSGGEGGDARTDDVYGEDGTAGVAVWEDLERGEPYGGAGGTPWAFPIQTIEGALAGGGGGSGGNGGFPGGAGTGLGDVFYSPAGGGGGGSGGGIEFRLDSSSSPEPTPQTPTVARNGWRTGNGYVILWPAPGGGIYHGHPIGAGYSGIVVAH